MDPKGYPQVSQWLPGVGSGRRSVLLGVGGDACMFPRKHPALKGIGLETSVQLAEKYSLEWGGGASVFHLPAVFRTNSFIIDGSAREIHQDKDGS